IHKEQHGEQAKNEPEPGVKPFCDRHYKTPLLSQTTAPSSKTARRKDRKLIRTAKIKFDNLSGLFRRGEELPFLHSILASLHKQRVTADDASAAHFAVGRDNDFNLDLSRHADALGEFGIGRRGLALNLALTFVRVRLLRDHKTRSKQ